MHNFTTMESSALQQSEEILQAFKASLVIPEPADHTQAVEVAQIRDMLEPEQAMEHGYCRMPDGSLYIACRTDLGETTGKQFDWWFSCYCDDSEKYRLWHPLDHFEGHWDEGYHSVPCESRQLGHYIGHSHIVREAVGGITDDLHIDFTHPSQYFGEVDWQAHNITACLTARINVFDKLVGDTAVGHLCHMVREFPDTGVRELRSRFWLGDIKKNGGYRVLQGIVNTVGNTRLGRCARAPISLAAGVLRHCAEEMHVLSRILPDIYATHALVTEQAPSA